MAIRRSTKTFFCQPCDLTQESAPFIFSRMICNRDPNIGEGYLLKVGLIPSYFGQELDVHDMFWRVWKVVKQM